MIINTITLILIAVFQQDELEAVKREEKLLIILMLAIAFIAFLAIIFIIKSRNAIKSQLQIIEIQKEEIETKNAELEYINESLKGLNTEKNSIISLVAHDLKTPLDNIEGLANLILLEKSGLSSEQSEYTNLIIDSSRRGKDLIEDVLNMHELESEMKSTQLQQQDIIGPIKDVIKQNELMAKEHSVEIELSGSVTMEPVRTDAQYLKLIVANILSNAIKYSPKGGTVHMLIQEKERSWSFSIADEGIGMNEATIQRLMAPYSNIDGQDREGEKMAGSGFTLTRKLIEKLHGKIRIKSEVNKGAMVTVEFLK